jgi:CRP/FNR family cyclic AMP-dependent transcriptional regulator
VALARGLPISAGTQRFSTVYKGLTARYDPLEGQLALSVESVLRDHAFIQGLTAEQVTRLASVATKAVFQENEIIFADREHSSAFYFLVTGSVAIELRAARYAVCVQALGPGQVFGWSALLDRQDTLFQVRAREETQALRIEGEKLKALCREDPKLCADLLQRTLNVVASRVRATEERFAEMCGIRV